MRKLLERLESESERLDILSDSQVAYLKQLYTNIRISSQTDDKRIVGGLIKKGIYAGSKNGLVLTEKGKKVLESYGIKVR